MLQLNYACELELPRTFLTDGWDALAGLDKLQLLGVNIFALVRHSAGRSFTQLPSLTDLHVEMVGNLTGTHLSQEGLPPLPHLTRLVMTLPNTVSDRGMLVVLTASLLRGCATEHVCIQHRCRCRTPQAAYCCEHNLKYGLPSL